MDSSASDSRVGHVPLSAGVNVQGAPELCAAGGVVSLVDSPERAVFSGSSEFLIDDSISTASAVVVRPFALAAAQAFLSPRDERSETEEVTISAAHEGRTPARSSREGGYMYGDYQAGWYASRLAGHDCMFGDGVGSFRLYGFRPRLVHNHGAVLRRVRVRLWLKTFLRLNAACPRFLGAPRRGHEPQR